jgi:hypothetical protein
MAGAMRYDCSLYLDQFPLASHNRSMHGKGLLRLALVLLVLLAIAVMAGEKERLLFRPQPAEAYPARDSHEGLVVAADPFDDPHKSSAAFGKHDFRQAGFLPVLVVITNNTDRAVRLDRLSVQLLTRDRQKVESTPAEDVMRRLAGPSRPSFPGGGRPSPLPLPRRGSSKDSAIEVQVHEFNMRMVLPKSSASGFFYFDVGRGRDYVAGSQVYLTGMFWANDSKPLMFFEIKLDDALLKK